MCDIINNLSSNDDICSCNLMVKNCEICNRKTCYHTRVIPIYPLNYTICIDCSNKILNCGNQLEISEKWNNIINDNKEKYKIELIKVELTKLEYNKLNNRLILDFTTYDYDGYK